MKMTRTPAPRHDRKTRNFSRLHKDTKGSVLLEAAVVMPVLIVIIAGMTECGLAMYQYHLLSTAVTESVRQLIISRGTDKPHTNLKAAFDKLAGNLKGLGTQTMTIQVQDPAKADFNYITCLCDGTKTVNGTKQTADVELKGLLAAAPAKPAQVTVTFQCSMTFTKQFANLCPIKISMLGYVE
jgi:Flp pilus assembly protein TadG